MIEDEGNAEVFFIGDRQCLLASDVQGWFAELNLPVPSNEHVAPIAAIINRSDVLGFLWKDDPVYKKSRNQNASVNRLERIAKSLKTLEQDVPIALESTKKGYTGNFDELKRPYDDLLSAVNSCMPGFVGFLSRPRGRRGAEWHRVARRMGSVFKEASTAAGGPRLGFGKPTSPGILLLKKALLRLGVNETEETVVDALRSPRLRRRRKIGESKNDIPQAPRSI